MQWPYPAIAPVPLQHSPKFSDKHPWSALIIFAPVLSAKDVPDGQIYLIRTPSSALISTQFYHILPFFFFKVLSVYLTFQAVSSRCSFKESRLVLTKFKGKNGCLKYPIHNFLVEFETHSDTLFSAVISDLKNSQNLHFHQFSPDLFKGGVWHRFRFSHFSHAV